LGGDSLFGPNLINSTAQTLSETSRASGDTERVMATDGFKPTIGVDIQKQQSKWAFLA